VTRTSGTASTTLPVDISTEPLIAWRTWALTGRHDGSQPLLRPVAGRARPWRPREIAEATCRGARFHRSPHVGCTCGLHGTHGFEILRKTKNPAVLGRVAMWGRIVEHEHGYRAEFAYPQRMRLICQFCFWEWGPRAAGPRYVGWFPRDDLIPLCDEHLRMASRHGMEPHRLLSGSEIMQRLLDAYAVDALAL
jgi:hypothetical protein